MRIACVHLPQFALQSVTRTDPSLRGAAVAVVGGSLLGTTGPAPVPALHSPVVVACSRAAWALGVRLGMTAPAVRALGNEADLRVVSGEPGLERETVRAIGDALLAASPMVDLGGRVGAGGAHLALYAEVPSKMRGAAFGDKLLEVLDGLGLTGRVGIADDRFTAWVAAAHGDSDDGGVVSVPRGGSAAFLAPRPLSLLSIAPEVQHMLEALGVATLGEFAALPAPSVARPIEADYQALARGEGGGALHPYLPAGLVREEVSVGSVGGGGSDAALSGPAAIALVAHRLALRLAGRASGARRLEVELSSGVGPATRHDIPLDPERALGDAEDLATALAVVVDDAHGLPAYRLRVTASAESARVDGSEASTVVPINARLAIATFAPANAAHAAVASGGAGPRGMDAMTLVLSSAGSLFSLSPPTLGAERRDAHRRTRRGKQRRRIVPTAQSRLFVGMDR